MRVADLGRLLRAQGARTVLIDGRSGSGKTTLTDLLVRSWPDAAVLRLEDVYPGWDGLARGSDHLLDAVLERRAAGAAAAYRSWNWATGAPGGEHLVDPDRPLVVDGVGSLTAASRALVDAAVWVEAPDELRRERALARDGDVYRPHWERWATQEDAFIAEHQPARHADWTARPVAGNFDLTHRPGCSVVVRRRPVSEPR